MLSIHKIAVALHLQVTATPSPKDNFRNPLVQEVDLPATFLFGEACQLTYPCLKCHQKIDFKMGYGAFIAAKTWSLKRIANQQNLLDEVGQLLSLELETPTENAIVVAHYYKAVLDIAMVGYYRCPHCAAQYLIGYARHIADNESRGIPEPDTMHVQCIAQVELDEPAFLQALNEPA
jgi:hypothetical protein